MASRKSSDKSNDDHDIGRSRSRLSGSKLARRARSFKDDFIDKIASIRSSSRSMSGSRSNSPMLGRSRSRKDKSCSQNGLDSQLLDSMESGLDTPKKALEEQHKDMQLSLRYFKDVIAKNRFEMLPGNATLLLETVTHIHTILKSCAMDEQNTSVVSSLNQLYQSVAEVIKQCDDLLIVGEQTLNREHLMETIMCLEDAVQNLITMAMEKITERENRSNQSESSLSNRCSHCSTVSSDQSQYRMSLSEITMSPYERQLLELTTKRVLEKHLCTQPAHAEAESPPPPKPPLPDRYSVDESLLRNESPPPLPPKMRNHNASFSVEKCVFGTASLSLERLNKSDNSSIGSTGESSQKQLSSSSSSFATIQNSSSYTLMGAQQVQQIYSTSTSYATVDSVKITSVRSELQMGDLQKEDNDTPPALPAKTRKKGFRLDSCLNNLPNRSSFNDAISNGHSLDSDNPPPLPLKKKHIMAYMEMFGNCAHSNTAEFLQRSAESYSLLQAEWQRHDMLLQSAQSCSFDAFNFSSPNHSSVILETSSPPPALPPRRNQLSSLTSSQSAASTSSPPSSPLPLIVPSTSLSTSFEEQPRSPSSVSTKPFREDLVINGTPPTGGESVDTSADILLESEVTKSDADPLAELDVTQWLVFKEEDDSPALRGGHPDALIVLATQANEKDFVYLEAFLITYRTFVSPSELIEKLVTRFSRFDIQSDPQRRKAAREAFSLLVRVTDDLTMLDLEGQLLEQITEFSYELLRNGELPMGFTLRKIWVAKYLAKLSQLCADKTDNSAVILQPVSGKQSTLLDFKSEHIAEQMTLLDAQLFNSIEIPEVLLYVMELKEEKSPNLTIFTEQFNKMSFWARTRILEQNDAKERERYMCKFMKVMKHLRKLNNFNSYLALLAALDCAAVRRLEWNQKILDTLESFCILIDSASSFRQYRVVLSATEPPCIPYIGLVLQDLTFVHHGNSNYLNEDVVNFLKRWQQSSIVANMKRFQNVSYNYKSRDAIMSYFSNFDDFLDEDELWKISKTIKP